MAGLQAGAPILWKEYTDVFHRTDKPISETFDEALSECVNRANRAKKSRCVQHDVKKNNDMVDSAAIWNDAFDGFEKKEVYSDWGVRFDNAGKLLSSASPMDPPGVCGHYHRVVTPYGVICAGCGVSSDNQELNSSQDESTHADDTRKRTSTINRGERSGTCIFSTGGYRGADANTRMLFNASKKEESDFKRVIKAVQPLLDWRIGARRYLINNMVHESFQLTTQLFPSRGCDPIKTAIPIPVNLNNMDSPENAPVVRLFDEFAEQLVKLEESESYDIMNKRSEEQNAIQPSVKAAEVRGDLQIIHNTGYPHIQHIFTELAKRGRNATQIEMTEDIRCSFMAIRRILDGKCQLISAQPSFSPHDTKNAILKMLKQDSHITPKLLQICQSFLINEVKLTPFENESSLEYLQRVIDVFLKMAPGKALRRGVVIKTNGMEAWDYIASILVTK